MATDEKTTTRVRQQPLQPIAFLTPEAHAARELQRELQEMKDDGIQLDRADRPGGKFRGTDGKHHDSEGRIIDEDGEPTTAPAAAVKAVTDIKSAAELDALEEQIAVQRKAIAQAEKDRLAAEKEQEKKEAAAEKERQAAAKKSGR